MKAKERKCRSLCRILSAMLLIVLICPSHDASGETRTAWPLSAAVVNVNVIGDYLYGLSNGVHRWELNTGEKSTVIPGHAMMAFEELGESYTYFITEEYPGILNIQSSKVYQWTGNELEQSLTLHPSLPMHDDFGVRCVASDGILWIEVNGGLYAADLSTGAVRNVGLDDLIVIKVHPEGGIVAMQSGGSAWKVLRLLSPDAAPMVLASVSGQISRIFTVDHETGDVYALVDGMLSRLEGDAWKPLRPAARAGDMTGFAVWKNEYIAVDRESIKKYPLAAVDMTTLTIRGGSPYYVIDASYMAANPTIGIKRLEARVSTEEIFTAIQAGDDSVDLFCLPAGYGLKALIDKGYAASEGLEPLLEQVERMHPYLRDTLMREGKVYGYPAYLRGITGWWQNPDYLDVKPYPTLMSLLDDAEAWEKEHGFPILAESYSDSLWSREDAVRYIMIQWIMTHDAADLHFQDKELEALFLRALELSSRTYSLSDTIEQPEVLFMESIDMVLLSTNGHNYQLVQAPAVAEGLEPAYLANVWVYLVNPYSPHLEEAVAFLKAQPDFWMTYQLPLVFSDVQPARSEAFQVGMKAHDEIIEEIERSLAKAEPDEKRMWEDALTEAKKERQRYMERVTSLDFHPTNLSIFQSHYSPRIQLPLSPLLSAEEGLFPGLWPKVEERLDMCLEGALSPGDCLRQLDDMWQKYRRENPE